MKVAICDDNQIILEQMEKIISNYGQKNNINIVIHSYTEGKQVVKNKNLYDLLFLDIEIKEENGILIAQEIRKKNKSITIIFVTSYLKYMRLSFSVHPFSYVVKPISEKKITDIMNEYIEYTKSIYNMKHEVIFSINRKQTLFLVDDIVYLEYMNRSIIIHLRDGSNQIAEKMKISDAFEQMKSFGFGRPHKSFIVNYKYIDYIYKFDIYLLKEGNIPLSQKYAKQFRENYNEYLRDTLFRGE